jgi:hypothetical protein
VRAKSIGDSLRLKQKIKPVLSSNHQNYQVGQIRSACHVVRAPSAKFGLHAGNMKINAPNEE